MGKLDDMMEYRMQGLALGRDIAKKAKEAGKDPLEAIEQELRDRKRCHITVCYKASEWSRDHKSAMRFAYNSALVVAMAILWDLFGFGGRKRLPDFVNAYIRYSIEINKGPEAGGTSIDEVIDLLKEKTGTVVELSADDITVDFLHGKGKDRRY